ncbi:MAG: sodium-independent anion transporter, partial [Crocinitomicaceae bacterium]|nr:sodium-independent anion transporter [Crocinitomicaceae bacterium]
MDQKHKNKKNFKSYIPLLGWLKDYKREWIKGDVRAGLTVGVMLIPQGMAYAMLAGLPPIYGLYASIVPLLLYAIFGTSRQLAVGPVAMVALLISSGVGVLATAGSSEFIALAILAAFMVGVFQLTLGLFKVGFIVNFLSHPVISGFTSAAALIIGLSQLKHLSGLNIPRGKVHETLYQFFSQIGDVHFLTVAIGGGAIVLLLLIKKYIPKIPGPLVVVFLTTLLVGIFGWHEYGVKIVGNVPSGLPSISFAFFNLSNIADLLPIVITISLVEFMESIAVAKAIQAKHKDYKIDANQELIGLGLANIGGS